MKREREREREYRGQRGPRVFLNIFPNEDLVLPRSIWPIAPLIEFRPFIRIDYMIDLLFFVSSASPRSHSISRSCIYVRLQWRVRVNFRKIDSMQLWLIFLFLSLSLPCFLPSNPRLLRNYIVWFAWLSSMIPFTIRFSTHSTLVFFYF